MLDLEFGCDLRRVHLGSMMAVARQSRKRDLGISKAGEQGGEKVDIADFSSRLRAALEGPPKITPADLHRLTGLAPQSIHRWVNGATPDPATALALADALKVDFRWLATGQGRQNRSEQEEDWVTLPHLDIFAFGDGVKPAPDEHIKVRRDWLGRVRAASGLWLADMPSDGAPEVGREGDSLVCVDPTPPLVDGRTYILLVGGRPLVRKVRIRPDGLELRTGDPADAPMVVSADQADDLVAVGRVVGSISLRSV